MHKRNYTIHAESMGSKQKPKRSVIKLTDCEGLSNEYFLPYVYRIVYLSGFPREKEPIGDTDIAVDDFF